jgi:hypothetical protein
MMAPKLAGDAVLGGHHLYGTPRTMTGVIRMTTLLAVPRRNSAETGRAFEMATGSMIGRHEDNRMGAGKSISQINSFASTNKYNLCRDRTKKPHHERLLRTCQAIFSPPGNI